MRRLLSLSLLLTAVVGLAGCNAINSAVSGGTNYLSASEAGAKSNQQHIDDLGLKTLLDTMCITPYGAIVRNASGNPNAPRAIVDACGLPQGITLIQNTSGVSMATGTGPVSVQPGSTIITPAAPTTPATPE